MTLILIAYEQNNKRNSQTSKRNPLTMQHGHIEKDAVSYILFIYVTYYSFHNQLFNRITIYFLKRPIQIV